MWHSEINALFLSSLAYKRSIDSLLLLAEASVNMKLSLLWLAGAFILIQIHASLANIEEPVDQTALHENNKEISVIQVILR